MTRQLVDRYTSDWPSPFTPAGELVYETPRRERQMIQLAQRQIDAQKVAAREIARGSLAGAQVIAREIEQQTYSLTAAIDGLGGRLTDGLADAAENILVGIDRLGDRICASLHEIRWQLAQQAQTLDQVLATLRNSRNNEAQQLVRQGVRHFVNEQYEKAEERFKEALRFDSTDYQVLLNLAFIEIHKGSAKAAEGYFRDALTLPDQIDRMSKLRALWALARLHYAESNHKRALEVANQALGLDSAPPAGALFTAGIYAALTTDTSLSLSMIRSAIEKDPGLFARTAVEPDLEAIRSDTLRLLSDLASTALLAATQAIKATADGLENVEEAASDQRYKDILDGCRNKLAQVSSAVRSASYADCLLLERAALALRDVVGEIKKCVRLYRELSDAEMKAGEVERKHGEVVKLYGSFAKEQAVRNPGCLFGLAMYAVPGFLAGWLAYRGVGGMGFIATPLWPLMFLFSLIALGFEKPGSDDYILFTAVRDGVLLGLLACAVLWFVVYKLPRLTLEAAKEENAFRRERIGTSEAELRSARAAKGAAERAVREHRELITKRLSEIGVPSEAR